MFLLRVSLQCSSLEILLSMPFTETLCCGLGKVHCKRTAFLCMYGRMNGKGLQVAFGWTDDWMEVVPHERILLPCLTQWRNQTKKELKISEEMFRVFSLPKCQYLSLWGKNKQINQINFLIAILFWCQQVLQISNNPHKFACEVDLFWSVINRNKNHS